MLFDSFLYLRKKTNANSCQTFILYSCKISNGNGKDILINVYMVDVATVLLIDSQGRFSTLKSLVRDDRSSWLLYKLYLGIWSIICMQSCVTFYTEVVGVPIAKQIDDTLMFLINKRIDNYLEEILSNCYNDIK